MSEFRYGPVELYLVQFEGGAPDGSALRALADLLDTGIVRLIDLVLIAKSADGDLDIAEIESDLEGMQTAGESDLVARGLVSEEDIVTFAEDLPPGTSAAVLALEMTYQRAIASQVANAGGSVVRMERIPAPVVNALVDLIEIEQGV